MSCLTLINVQFPYFFMSVYSNVHSDLPIPCSFDVPFLDSVFYLKFVIQHAEGSHTVVVLSRMIIVYSSVIHWERTSSHACQMHSSDGPNHLKYSYPRILIQQLETFRNSAGKNALLFRYMYAN